MWKLFSKVAVSQSFVWKCHEEKLFELAEAIDLAAG